jgi:O-antigen/teichoic acid export membrane protein
VLRRSVAIAIVDSGLSSLATLCVGLYAARVLTLEQLGIYGLLFLAVFVLGSSTVTQLYFTPVEVAFVSCPSGEQLRDLRRTARDGTGFAAAVAVVAVGIGVLVAPDASWRERLLVGAGALGVATFSPVQDHIRRVQHQAGRSSRAMQVSVVQLVAAVASLVALRVLGVAAIAIPLAALAIANLLSLSFGVLVARHDGEEGDPAAPPLGGLVRLGGWLVIGTQSEQLGNFVAVALLGAIAGAAPVGQLEAARQLTQPLFVLAIGIQSVLRPRVMAAAQHGDRASARRLIVGYASVIAACGLAYLVVAGARWPHNPLVELFPNAYDQPGMVAAFIGATVVALIMPMIGIQAIATGQHRSIARLSVSNQVVYLGGVLLLAGSIGALAVPAATVLYVATWALRFLPTLRRIYGASTEASPEVVGVAGS